MAFARERENKMVLFIIRIDDAIMKNRVGWLALLKAVLQE
jgi:hypothetical protein